MDSDRSGTGEKQANQRGFRLDSDNIESQLRAIKRALFPLLYKYLREQDEKI